MKHLVESGIRALQYALTSLAGDKSLQDQIVEVANAVATAIRGGNRVYFCGNGGSAADSQHLAAELVGRFKLERTAWPAEALTVNTSILTALANDYDYAVVFARQVQALGRPGDIIIGLSTSGNAANVVKALETAKGIGMTTIGIVGQKGGVVSQTADICLCLPADDTPRVQELTILVGHMICEIVENSLADVQN